jgi:hypothetical protein
VPISDRPKIDDLDPKTGQHKYANFAAYEQAKDAWSRQEAIREFRESLASRPVTKTGNDLGSAILGVSIFALLVYGAWAGVSWATGALRGHSAAEAIASDPRDEQIKELNARIAQLEARPTNHHYELRVDGLRTFRFDPATGSTCIQLTTKADWKRPETIRQGCQYQDWAFGEGATSRDYFNAECQLVGDRKACDQFVAMAAK